MDSLSLSVDPNSRTPDVSGEENETCEGGRRLTRKRQGGGGPGGVRTKDGVEEEGLSQTRM